mmetsp:Transcript_42452/g.74421  ORF Transcript_42452/g.74421 Transcript_42452/m.74421 type:complete len:109 (+) Transcript_42452:2-328(+)
MQKTVMQKLVSAEAKAEDLEVTAQKLEDRLRPLEESAGREPEAEVAQVLSHTPILPEFANAETRLRVANGKSNALEGLVENLRARMSFLEINVPLEPKKQESDDVLRS